MNIQNNRAIVNLNAGIMMQLSTNKRRIAYTYMYQHIIIYYEVSRTGDGLSRLDIMLSIVKMLFKTGRNATT